MRRIVLLIVAALAAPSPLSTAQATIRITGDPGGLLLEYAEKFQQAQASGEAIVIDGACLSACTLVVGMARSQVCVTPRAVLGFHAAWRPTPGGNRETSWEATQAMMKVYPPDLRQWISRRGGLKPRMIFLRGRELAAMLRPCGATATAVDGRTGDAAALRAARATYGAGRER